MGAHAGPLLRGHFSAGVDGKSRRFLLGQLQQLAVAQKIGDAKIGEAGLPGAKELARSALGKIELGQLEPILRAHHGIQPLLAQWRNAFAGHEDAVAFGRASAYAPAQLMQLRQSEALGVFHHHHRCVGHVDADLDDGGRYQHVDFAALEAAHDDFFFVGIKPAMEQADAQTGKRPGAQLFVHLNR